MVVKDKIFYICNMSEETIKYQTDCPHALTSATSASGVFPMEKQVIGYNHFDMVSSITEGNKQLAIQYGHHRQRITQQYTNGSNTTHKRWVGACEYITENGQQSILTYLSGPEGVFALHIKNPNGTANMRYIHTDHLGSWNTITDTAGNLLQELSFDAWGNRRDPNTWRAYTTTPPTPLFDRGFTGHEHLYGFGLINMNGRVYDPVVSRMLSPDNFIQAPDFSQSFNRYSYVTNNPLKYTDPSGNSYIETVKDWYSFEGGSFWYRGSHYNYNSENGTFSNNSGHNIGGSGFKYSNGSYYYNGQSTSWNNVFRNHILPNSTAFTWNPIAGNEVYREQSRNEINIYYNGAWVIAKNQRLAFGLESVNSKDQTNGGDIHNGLNIAGKISYVLGMANIGADILETEYVRQATYNAKIAGQTGKIIPNYLKVISRTGKVLGGVGVLTTYGIAGYEVLNGNANTSTWVDVGATTLMFGLAIIGGPIVAGGAVVGGVVYGGARLFYGVQVDGWINDNWGYNNK